MSQPNQQYCDTIAVADAALGKISALRQPADPRSFALWFKYAGGNSGLLCAAVNTRLARYGTLSASDIEELYNAHVAPGRAAAKSDRIGTCLAGEIDQILATVEKAERAAGHHSRNVASAAIKLSGKNHRDGVRTIVEGLLQSIRTLTADNAKLQTELQAVSEEIAQLRREIVELRIESQVDPLTSLGNRRFFATALGKSIAECRAANEPLTLVLADVDRIKTINENYGHVVGDRVLRFIAMVIREAITGRDVAARFDDDAFAVILPRTSLAAGVRVAEQLRRAVTKCELVSRTTGEKARLTLSAGVASLEVSPSGQALTEAAEMCLHGAKLAGRNCVISEADEKLYAAVAGNTLSAAAVPFVRA